MQIDKTQLEKMEVAIWLANYPKVIGKILNYGGEITIDTTLEIIELLEKEELEYLVPLFITMIRMFYKVEESLNKIMVENPIGVWQEESTKQFYKELKDKLKAEIREK